MHHVLTLVTHVTRQYHNVSFCPLWNCVTVLFGHHLPHYSHHERYIRLPTRRAKTQLGCVANQLLGTHRALSTLRDSPRHVRNSIAPFRRSASFAPDDRLPSLSVYAVFAKHRRRRHPSRPSRDCTSGIFLSMIAVTPPPPYWSPPVILNRKPSVLTPGAKEKATPSSVSWGLGIPASSALFIILSRTKKMVVPSILP